MRILVTGERGGLGSYLLERLSHAHEVQGWERWDGAPVDRILHCLVRHPYHTPDQIVASNLTLLPQLKALFLQSQARDLVYFSSIVVYGTAQEGCLNEASLAAPADAYAISKRFGEAYLLASQLPGYTLRIPALIEPGSRRNLISRLVCDIQQGLPLHLSHVDRPFNALLARERIGDFLENLPLLADQRETFNLMAKPAQTLEQLCVTLAQALKQPLRLERSAPTSPHRYFSTQKVEQALGFDPGTGLDQLAWAGILPDPARARGDVR